MKEYVVTLKSADLLDDFYEDIETPGGSLYIPGRAVECTNRRPLSRNTHYLLTSEEAELVAKDHRVAAVQLITKELGLKPRPGTVWDKSYYMTENSRNWALLRCYEGKQRLNWGVDATQDQIGEIFVAAAGRDVDVVIVDGHIDPDHPEFAIDSNGTGGSRVQQFNWFSLNPQVAGTDPSVYQYPTNYASTPDEADNNNHGCHVAGIACGNTQGWAKQANIFNIDPYWTNPNWISELLIFDYIRAWHSSKPVNPITGKKNPTVVNNSWGYSYEFSIDQVAAVAYRGQYYTNLTGDDLRSFGIFNDNTTAYVPVRYPALDADIEDAIADGIIVVGSAGNEYTKIDVDQGEDFLNHIWLIGFDVPLFYHQGCSPGAAGTSICVGSVGLNSSEYKSTFSNCGPRVDVYAPGSYIASSLQTNVGTSAVSDIRNAAYYQGKISGTSMASPQVAGVLACLAGDYPRLNQESARQYLTKYSSYYQLADSTNEHDNYWSLQGSPNRYLKYWKERVAQGPTWPKTLKFVPESTSIKYPRPR